MIIRQIKFIGSSPFLENCPEPDFPEYAFTGRSNVGKSSLINMLCQRKNLARISSTPGKTQLINHFLINNEWYLADLPGYGYARAGKKIVQQWGKLVLDYIRYRKNLMNLFLLIDARHPDLVNDKKFMDYLGEHKIPFIIVFTKTDKLSAIQLEKNKKLFIKSTLQRWESLPAMYLTSAKTTHGRDDMLAFIKETSQLFKNS